VIFWDTSALVPLLVREPESPAMRRALRADSQMLVWWGTYTECESALARRVRDGVLSHRGRLDARAVLEQMATAWSEVLASSEVRSRASLLLGRHALRAADALQLGAALVWAGGQPVGHRFNTLEARLRQAALAEGFVVL
jgi:uncharacterized protein with PIN domain